MRWGALLAPIVLTCCATTAPPVIDTPGSAPSLAVIISGDNGWRALERQLAAQFRADHIDVAGINSARYFAQRRTPQEIAATIDGFAAAHPNARRILLVGYSRGAGVLPFAFQLLRPDVKQRVTLLALLGLEPTIDFQVPDRAEIAVAPQVARLTDVNILCVQGAEETDSLCPGLPNRLVLPGGHHLTVDYRALARQIEASQTR